MAASGKTCVGRVLLLWIYTSSLVVKNAGTADHISTRCLHNDFITADRALLPFNSISAFNDSLTLDDNPLKFIVNNSVARELWCSNYTGSNYVEMNFEEPVIIEGVISRGAFLQSRRFYIANFSLLFSSNDVDDLETYSEDFIATSPQQVYTIVDYIVAKKIRFRINEFGTNAEFCWQLQLVGCRADEVIQDTTTTEIVTEIMTSTRTVTMSPSCVDGSSGALQQRTSTGILAGGVVLLVIGVVLIAIAVLLCVVMIVKRTRSKSADIDVRRHPTMVNVENTELYTMGNSSDGPMLNNQLYDMDETTAATDEAPPEYATVDKARAVKTTPNTSYRALDREEEQQGEEEDRNYSNIREIQENGSPVIPSGDHSSLDDEVRYSSIPEGAGQLSTEATSNNSVEQEEEGEYSVPAEVLADDGQKTEADNYETIPIQ